MPRPASRGGLFALVILGGVIRLAALDAQSFWYDEAYTANVTTNSVGDLVSGRAKDNGNPPLYWILARGWAKLAGTTGAAYRSLPVLCSTLAIPFVFLVARRLADERAGLLAAALFAVSPCALELADEARCYALLQLLAAVNMWLFLRWYDSGNTLSLVAWSVSVAAAALTHYYAFALPAVQGAALLFAGGKRGKLVGFAIGAALAAGLFSFWIPSFFAQLATKGNLVRMGAGWKMQFLGTPIVLAFGRMLAWKDSPLWQLAGGTGAALLLLWLPAGAGIWRLRRDRFGALLLAGWWLLPILGPLVVALLFSPIYATRYATIGLPAFAILAGIGLAGWSPGIRTTTLAATLALSAVSIGNYMTRPIKPDWRQATAALLQSSPAGEPIVFDTDIEVLPFRFYFPRDEESRRTYYGVTSISAEGTLLGVTHRDGVRVDPAERPIQDELRQAESFSLFLCESNWPLEKYREVFATAGFVEDGMQEFYRITACRFTKGEGRKTSRMERD
jgi:4-amino-4-deoxy-L-arabinose transferase-like glycosyltransferase